MVERDAKTAQRLKDVKAATDMLDYCDLPVQSQRPLRLKESPVLSHAVSRSSPQQEDDVELKNIHLSVVDFADLLTIIAIVFCS